MVPMEHTSVLKQANERFEKELLSQKLAEVEIEYQQKLLMEQNDRRAENLRLKEKLINEAHYKALRNQIRLN